MTVTALMEFLIGYTLLAIGIVLEKIYKQKGEWKMLTIEEILSVLTDNGEEEITMEDYGDFFIISVGGDEDQVLVFFLFLKRTYVRCARAIHAL